MYVAHSYNNCYIHLRQHPRPTHSTSSTTGFLQCFDAVGWVIWPAKIVPEMTYKVSSGTLSLYTRGGDYRGDGGTRPPNIALVTLSLADSPVGRLEISMSDVILNIYTYS